jgi:hypothetical protein
VETKTIHLCQASRVGERFRKTGAGRPSLLSFDSGTGGVWNIVAISCLGRKLPRRGLAPETVEAGSGFGLSKLGNLC